MSQFYIESTFKSNLNIEPTSYTQRVITYMLISKPFTYSFNSNLSSRS